MQRIVFCYNRITACDRPIWSRAAGDQESGLKTIHRRYWHNWHVTGMWARSLAVRSRFRCFALFFLIIFF